MYRRERLPDITSQALTQSALSLDWVGMENIDVPISMAVDGDEPQQALAKASIFVSVDDPAAKGIHMSRLHRRLNDLSEGSCTQGALDKLLKECVESQSGISNNARIDLAFDLLLKKPALLSGEFGYQSYKTSISGEIVNGKYCYTLGLTIPWV
ncbi:GTP cyclohydrolase, FolE2/MptA family [Halioglobus pacificus]|uniref:Uncharacterized protein n=1 Tax=Parahalioglobus pacificus TaxID=930806 RepID=A0A918XDR5_9GAMM|nr:GTP cyclohydrolase, FolE2/MptA family [Halioglobus pacificus]GHD27559.1 hypothetical protein GCM10007053_06050 [Halioglobus pacificus]